MDKTKSETLLSVINDLHAWRNEHNHSNIGEGYDQYKPDDKYHYPEAYAMWGNGYLQLYEYTHKKEYLNYATDCFDWLNSNKSPQYCGNSWGLPWSWDGRPKETSYLVTTCFVGNFFLKYYSLVNSRDILELCEGIASWIVEENGYREESGTIGFNYSDHSSLNYPIYNAISIASGFFARLYFHSRNSIYCDFSQKSFRYVMNHQNSDGSWHYSSKSTMVDNVHTGFVLEGLCDVYAYLKMNDRTTLTQLRKGIALYINNLYHKNGFGYEKIPLSLKTRVISAFLPSIFESRIHGYASGIRALSKVQKITESGSSNFNEVIVKYIINNLINDNGSFKFRSRDASEYIRNEGHIFDALTYILTMRSPRYSLDHGTGVIL